MPNNAATLADETIIANAHRRIRALMAAQEAADSGSPILASINRESDWLIAHAMGTDPETGDDALLHIDLAIHGQEAIATDADLDGLQRFHARASLVALASAATAISRLTGKPLRDEGTISGLANFCIRAQTQYAQAPAP
jgi:hypothetical protein